MTIKINLKIFLFAIIFYFTKQIQIYAILMFFAFCHEMGHLLCGVIVGLKPKSLKIMPLGLCVEFSVLPKEYNKKTIKANQFQIKKIFIAMAGPITNIVIIFVTLLFKNMIDNTMFMEIICTNMLIALFNLLPIYPLDGGRIIKSCIYIICGRKKAINCTYYISNTAMIIITSISSIAIYYYKNIAILFIIMYLWGMVAIENKKYFLKNRIDKIIENS
jgi:stage IV sporulation protein FB